MQRRWVLVMGEGGDVGGKGSERVDFKRGENT